ncbi:hypothetical protein DFH06DRAFT_699054 [Mycena polygramma]|nr:hypothetical protein DFH06DRAFT_699054 [Mycena polygramma]
MADDKKKKNASTSIASTSIASLFAAQVQKKASGKTGHSSKAREPLALKAAGSNEATTSKRSRPEDADDNDEAKPKKKKKKTGSEKKNQDSSAPPATSQAPSNSPSMFNLPVIFERDVKTDIPVHLQPLFVILLPYFDAWKLRPLLPELVEILDTLTSNGATVKEFISDPVGAFLQFSRSQGEQLLGVSGLAYLYAVFVPKDLLVQYDLRVRAPPFKPWHDQKQTELMRAVESRPGPVAKLPYGGQTKKTAAERGLGDSGLKLQHKTAADAMRDEGVTHECIPIFATRERSQRFTDMAELVIQGLCGLRHSINHYFMAESFRFTIAPDLLALPRAAPGTGNPPPVLAVIFDAPGVTHQDIDHSLRSATIQEAADIVGQIFDDVQAVVVDIKHSQGSNSAVHLKPGESSAEIQFLKSTRCALVFGENSFAAICDLEVLLGADGQPLQFGVEMRVGARIDATWADGSGAIHLIGGPHLGRGRHMGRMTQLHVACYMSVVAAFVLAREFLFPHPATPSNSDRALEYLRSAPDRQAQLNKSILAQLHDKTAWDWIEAEVLPALPYELLSWVHLLEPGEGHSMVAKKPNSSSSNPSISLQVTTLYKQHRETRLGLNIPRWAKKTVAEGDLVRWDATPTTLTVLDERDEVCLEIPYAAAWKLRGSRPLVVAAMLYTTMPMSAFQDLWNDPEMNLSFKQLFERRVPDAPTRKTILRIMKDVGLDVDVDSLPTFYRFMALEDDDDQAYHPVHADRAHFKWERSFGSESSSKIVIMVKGVQAGDMLRPVATSDRVSLVDRNQNEVWGMSVQEAWTSRNPIGKQRLICVGMLMGHITSFPRDDPESELTTTELFERRVPVQATRQKILAVLKEKMPKLNVSKIPTHWRFLRPEDDWATAAWKATVAPQGGSVIYTRNLQGTQAVARVSLPGQAVGTLIRPVIRDKRITLVKKTDGRTAWSMSVPEAWTASSKGPVCLVAVGLIMGVISLEDLTFSNSLNSTWAQ